MAAVLSEDESEISGRITCTSTCTDNQTLAKYRGHELPQSLLASAVQTG